MPLANPGDIPFRLAVADDDKLRALHESDFPVSLLSLTADGIKSTMKPVNFRLSFPGACRKPV
jgi:hypothetical protein